MSVYGIAYWLQLDRSRKTNRVVVRETRWGLVIEGAETGTTCDFVAEGILKILAVANLFAPILPWVSPEGSLGDATLMAQLSLSVAFLVIGFGVDAYAGRGFRQEVHLDAIQGDVRFATRNSRNISNIRRRIPMTHVQSGLLKRTKSKNIPTQLHLCLKSKGPSLPIASGEKHNRVSILEQMEDRLRMTERRARF